MYKNFKLRWILPDKMQSIHVKYQYSIGKKKKKSSDLDNKLAHTKKGITSLKMSTKIVFL